MEKFDAHEVAEKIMAAIQKEYKELKTLNVMILGKTGVGKSTLINNMFNQKMAETGARVIIMTGCINVLESRVSGTSINNNSCIS